MKLINFTSGLFILFIFLKRSQHQETKDVIDIGDLTEVMSFLKIGTTTAETIVGIEKVCSLLDEMIEIVKHRRKSILKAVSSLKNTNLIYSKGVSKFLLENLQKIRVGYSQMKRMLPSIHKYPNSTKKAFATLNLTPGPYSMVSTISNVISTYFGTETEEFSGKTPMVDRIAGKLQYGRPQHLCPTTSGHQFFHQVYLEMTVSVIQSYLIYLFSYILMDDLGEDTSETELWIVQRNYEKYNSFFRKQLHNVIPEVDSDLRRCDPESWVEKVNFDQLTRLSQGYLVNQKNIFGSSCSNSCEINSKRKVACSKDDSYCLQNKSPGEILECDSDFHEYFIDICPSTNPAFRYKYFEINRGFAANLFYGQNASCPLNETHLNSWFMRPNEVCSFCFCIVDEKSERSDRFFNLREVTSDIYNNMVVTGVRFVKKNRVIYLQIQHGELAPLGGIRNGSTKWKDVEEYTLTKLNDGVDYVTLDYHRNLINLNDVRIKDPRYVVTGLKFSFKGPHLFLKVRITKFDFTSGRLIDPKLSTKWIFELPTKYFKAPLKENNKIFEGPKVSTRAPGESVITSSAYNTIEFTYSDKYDDACQTTLPFFDTQSVYSHLPTPLSGVGLYHKGYDGYGGFLAPKIFTLNILPYI